VLNVKAIDEHGAHLIILLLPESSVAYALATSLFLTLTQVTLFRFVVNNVKGAKGAHLARRLRRKSTSKNQKNNLV
jgi:hypothetical protein